MPWRYHDQRMPLAFGIYGEGSAPGAHIVDLTAGGAMDAPVDELTKGLIKFPVRAGGAVTIRQEAGDDKSDRVGKSAIGLGLTGGLLIPINRQHQMGIAIRNLFAGGANPQGTSLNVGVTRHHNEYLDMFLDMQLGEGNIWRFHPGLEWLLARGVLRPRLGWGFREGHGIDSLATGVGFYVSPFQMDIAYLVPLKTLNDNAGEFRASLSYRFGRPQFSEVYYDRALEAASTLDNSVLQLTVKEAELKSSLSEVEQKRKIAAEELDNMKKRIELLQGQDVLGQRDQEIRELKERIRGLEGSVSEARARAAAAKAPEVKTYIVQPGDTLQSIARQFYGDPNQWRKIYGANADKIERGLPKPGSKLVIP
jgi:LysM repeat protein